MYKTTDLCLPIPYRTSRYSVGYMKQAHHALNGTRIPLSRTDLCVAGTALTSLSSHILRSASKPFETAAASTFHSRLFFYLSAGLVDVRRDSEPNLCVEVFIIVVFYYKLG
jgi:hypothetical protein